MKISEVLININTEKSYSKDSTNDILNSVKRNFKYFGLDVTINSINSEVFAKNYYQHLGYQVIDGTGGYNSKKLSELEDLLKRYCIDRGLKPNFYEVIDDNENKKHYYFFGFDRAGAPDYFVYKMENNSVIDAFFVEVKSKNGAMSHTQLMWLLRYPLIPVRLFLVEGGNQNGL